MSIERETSTTGLVLPGEQQLTIFEEQPEYPLTDLTQNNADYFSTLGSTSLTPSGFSMLHEQTPVSANWAMFHEIAQAMQGKRVQVTDITDSDELRDAWMYDLTEKEKSGIVVQKLTEAAQSLQELGRSLDNPDIWGAWVSGYLDQDHIRTAVNGSIPGLRDGATAMNKIMTPLQPGAGIDAHLIGASSFQDTMPRTYGVIVETSPPDMTVDQIRFRTLGAYLNYVTTVGTAQLN